MKIPASSRRRQSGMAVIVMLALLSIMFACLMANVRSLNQLDRELKLLERRQTRRLMVLTVSNAPPLQAPAPATPR